MVCEKTQRSEAYGRATKLSQQCVTVCFTTHSPLPSEQWPQRIAGECGLIWSGRINGDSVDCKSAASGMTGSIPVHSTKQYGIRQAVKSSPFQGEVTGSNPVCHTKLSRVRLAAIPPGLGPGFRKFESFTRDQTVVLERARCTRLTVNQYRARFDS